METKTIQVSLRAKDIFDEVAEFPTFAQAEKYFYKLARKRTIYPAQIVAAIDGTPYMVYRIDDVFASNRWITSLDLITGEEIKRRYIPSAEELTGRKSKIVGIRLSNIIVPVNINSSIVDYENRTGKSVSEIVVDALQHYFQQTDTILSELFIENR